MFSIFRGLFEWINEGHCQGDRVAQQHCSLNQDFFTFTSLPGLRQYFFPTSSFFSFFFPPQKNNIFINKLAETPLEYFSLTFFGYIVLNYLLYDNNFVNFLDIKKKYVFFPPCSQVYFIRC